MAVIAPLDCDCWRLARPLAYSDLLPDHICAHTADATLYLVERDDVTLPANRSWPVPVGARYLAFVLRQWAEHAPTQLGKKLAADPGWQEEVRRLARALGGDTSNPIREDLAANHELHEAMARWLRSRSLPDSPGTVRYLYDSAIGATGSTPTIGLLVSTFAYVQIDQRKGLIYDRDPVVSITGSSERSTEELYNCAKKVAIAHRDWLRRHGRSLLASPIQHLPEPTRADNLDLVREAVTGRSLLDERMERNKTTFHREVDHYLDDIYRRIDKRKKRQSPGVKPAKPPAGWRAEAKRLLREFYP
jgi:hypothetical protein